MRRLYSLLCAIVVLLCGCGRRADIHDYSIVPEPSFMVMKDGGYALTGSTSICFTNLEQNNPTVKYVLGSLRQLHLRPNMSGNATTDCMLFTINDTLNSELGDEGYLLEVRSDGIHITANTEAGLFYGYQTLVQMLPDDVSQRRYTRINLPACTILDSPRFAWRGSHLDVSRHFFSIKDVKRHLDIMAAFKLNRFHWHLTDDHGWRIASERYPRLNDVGSWRADRTGVPWDQTQPNTGDERQSYGGYYTKDEIREVVAYAAERHIEVIPEIEIPGHCAEILASYPELGCQGDDTSYQVQVGNYWPPRAILCAGSDSVMQFLFDILDEIIPLFPSQYIHIGGDEALKDNWQRCPRCQARMRQLGLSNVEPLQAWMIDRVAEHLAQHDKTIIGWDEIIDGGATLSATVMAWQNISRGMEAARRGYRVIMSPCEYCYLNFYQGEADYQPPAFPAQITLHHAYSFDPVPLELNSRWAENIIGGQCNLWAEYIETYDQAEYMLLPRLLATAECLWSPRDAKSWPHFRAKLVSQEARLRNLGYHIGSTSQKPIVVYHQADANGNCHVTIDWEREGTEVYYTVLSNQQASDTAYHPEMLRYTKPFSVPSGSTLKAQCHYMGEPVERLYEYHIE
ncbi:MAG: beta-N-acetylhexosaminidase [Bacteroidales bacterium]|nr:beta-N-acetylhexosaminidase [Bacteroidales bacterium]